jgi:hypothetical protein
LDRRYFLGLASYVYVTLKSVFACGSAEHRLPVAALPTNYLNVFVTPLMAAPFLASPHQRLQAVIPQPPIGRTRHHALDRFIGQGDIPRIALEDQKGHIGLS